VRIALIANEASGGGLDPEPLEETMRRHGADVRVYARRLKVPLAVIPMGTANDFARAAELPTGPEDACVLAATGEQLRALELGPLAYAVGALRAAASEQPLRCAWGMRRGTIAEQRDVCHARGHVIEVDLPPGTEFNVDGELLGDGMQRISVEHHAFELVVG
jgi:diacylglycerol kinase family enzyme